MNTTELKKLADDLTWVKHTADWSTCDKAAAELRRLHAENEAMRAQIWQGEPDVWQMVPKEPTDEMLRAGAFRTTPGVAYRAMLAVAPPTPQQKPLTDEQINQMWSDAHNDTSTMSLIHVLARAIEAAHNIGEKK